MFSQAFVWSAAASVSRSTMKLRGGKLPPFLHEDARCRCSRATPIAGRSTPFDEERQLEPSRRLSTSPVLRSRTPQEPRRRLRRHADKSDKSDRSDRSDTSDRSGPSVASHSDPAAGQDDSAAGSSSPGNARKRPLLGSFRWHRVCEREMPTQIEHALHRKGKQP